MKKNVLFICKKNETYGFTSYTRRSSGLYNSTRFIAESLNENGVKAHIVEVIDNNDIDREVTKYKPDIVVIEALWVVPEKFPVLMELHPKVKWCVHMHSGLPFLALEGIAMDWLQRYGTMGLTVIANSRDTFDAFKELVPKKQLFYLPNVYLSNPMKPIERCQYLDTINVGCFGAIRPMKNHLLQAIAAIKFAKERGLYLRFNINGSRVEVGGEPVLKNLRQLFDGQMNAELIEWAWHEPHDFIERLHQTIDLGMQVSMTETFNVVCADYVTAGIPVVCSKEVGWMSMWNKAEEDSVEDVVNRMGHVLDKKWLIRWNQRNLKQFSRWAQLMWLDFASKE
jgi:glycosyltransferase involved in cell wall biosynthesis